MSLLDILLLGVTVAVCAWRIFAPRAARKQLRLAPLGLIALALLQAAVEGVSWQFATVWLAIGVLALVSIFSHDAPKRRGALLGRIGLGVLALAAIAPFMLLLPAPVLARPDGPYEVGSQVFRWVDANRAEVATPLLDDKRNVVAQAWYRAAPGTKGRHSVYIDGLGHMPRQVSLFPGFMLESFGRIDTHAIADAGISGEQDKWPVVIFSPGNGASRAFYSGLAAALASRGYIVLALDHPYESAVTQLRDGSVVADAGGFPYSGTPSEREAFMVRQLDTRAADISFVIDRIANLDKREALFNMFDLDHVAVIGHSFGGASAVVAMDRDPRIKAAANIDGTLYGRIWEHRLTRPFLLLDSDHVETGHSEKNIADNKTLLANLDSPRWAYEISRANHYSFTDAPLFFAPPGRFALTLLIGGSRGPKETQRAAVDILDAFLSAPLGREPKSIEDTAARYSGIKGGPVH